MENDSDELPLHCAAKEGDIDAVMSILSHAECDVDAVDEASQHTALHVACAKGFNRIVELLLDTGASLRSCRSYEDNGEGYTALHMAAMGGRASTVELLVQRGADVHSLAYGHTPLHMACQFGYLEAASALLQSGSDVNVAAVSTMEGGYTPLHFAAEFGNGEVVRLLLSCGANIDAVNKYGRTALHCAWEYENHDVAELLLEIGGAFPSASGAPGASDVHCAVREDVVKMLLNCEEDINVRDAEGMTALHWSCRGKSPNLAECLLKSGADVNAAVFRDDDTWDFVGNTPLHFAIDEENWRIGFGDQADLVKLLLRWGGNVNAKESEGWTPLTEFLLYFSDHDDEQAIAKLFAKHVVKMQVQNLFVDKSNLEALSDHEPLRDFITACRTEIENMRSAIGDSSVTFFNVFTKGAVRLADFMANESIVNAFESRDFKRVFPIYAENLTNQFVHGRKRLGLLRKCDAVLNVSNLRHVPYVCMRLLKLCLTIDDLQSILKSTPL